MGIILALSDSKITPRSNSALGDWHATLRQGYGKLGKPTWLAVSQMKACSVTLEQWQLQFHHSQRTLRGLHRFP